MFADFLAKTCGCSSSTGAGEHNAEVVLGSTGCNPPYDHNPQTVINMNAFLSACLVKWGIEAQRRRTCLTVRLTVLLLLLLLGEYLAADGDLRGCRPACYSISLHLKLIANGPSLLWKYVWTGKVHWHAAHSQDHISRNEKARRLTLSSA